MDTSDIMAPTVDKGAGVEAGAGEEVQECPTQENGGVDKAIQVNMYLRQNSSRRFVPPLR